VNDGGVHLLGIAASGLLVLVAVGLSARAGLGLQKPLLGAAVRAAVQLAALGLVLTAVLAPGRSPALS
jgi:ABC-type iron transport system FetAB permease component